MLAANDNLTNLAAVQNLTAQQHASEPNVLLKRDGLCTVLVPGADVSTCFLWKTAI
jgi:hypothetical protein